MPLSRRHHCLPWSPLAAGCRQLLWLAVLMSVFHVALQARHKTVNSEDRKTLWACATDVIVLCSDVEPGDGRIESCLRKKKAFLTSMCANQRRTSDQLPAECKKDAEIHCQGENEDALQLMCLRKHRNRLSESCWQGLSRLQSDGWELLHSRFKMMGVDTPCSRTLIEVCKDIAPGYGALRACVDNNWKKLETQCGLKKREDPEIVPPACETDMLFFCKHIVKGDSRILNCLQSNEMEMKMSADCRSSIRLQAAGLDVVCASDVTRFCTNNQRTKTELVDCLHEHQEELAMGCTTRKHKFQPEELGASFKNLHTGDHADKCANDVKKFCQGIKPGHGLIQKCMLENKDKLSPKCTVPRGQVVPRGYLGAEDQRRALSQQPDYVQSGIESKKPGVSLLGIMLDIEAGAFEKNDLDSSGSLNMSELHKALEMSYAHVDKRAAADGVPDEGMGHLRRSDVRAGASDIMRKADLDGNGQIEIHEFHALFDHPSATLPGSNPDASSEEEQSQGREFDARKESTLLKILVNPWISTPLIAIVTFLTFAYRSSVRFMDKSRRRHVTSVQGARVSPGTTRRRR